MDVIMHILLTNDDGLNAKGIQILKAEMAAYADQVTLSAPTGERSASSHSMTIHRSLYCTEMPRVLPQVREIMISGTPVDCVKIAVEYFLKDDRPDLIISGINNGYNLGSDVLYSGTVAAAMEGHYYHIPAMAVSMSRMETERAVETAELVHQIVEKLFVAQQFQGVLNVNIPPEGDVSLANACVVPQTVQVYNNIIAEKADLDGSRCYRIVGDIDMTHAPEDSDVGCIRRNCISLTPLGWRQTAMEQFPAVRSLLTDI
jgi:5'-nucleotidase